MGRRASRSAPRNRAGSIKTHRPRLSRQTRRERATTLPSFAGRSSTTNRFSPSQSASLVRAREGKGAITSAGCALVAAGTAAGASQQTSLLLAASNEDSFRSLTEPDRRAPTSGESNADPVRKRTQFQAHRRYPSANGSDMSIQSGRFRKSVN